MGFEEVSAARAFNGAPLSFESLPHQAQVTTYSANDSITDSAASATAMATGQKVNNGVVSMAYPGDGHELTTVLEQARDRGQHTGLVTTTYMTHATPACFGAHEPTRNNTSQIAADYFNQSRPNVLFGGGANGMSPTGAFVAGYNVVQNTAGLLAFDPEAVDHISGQFGSSHLPYEYDGLGNLPHLHQMTDVALDVLDNNPDGFFMMLEGGRIDHAGHDNDIIRNVYETIEFANSVQSVLDWAAGRDDTLVIVTADHETGGLHVLADNGPGQMPTVSWSTTGHTGVNVPIYAWGPNADLVTGVLDNTDLVSLVNAPEPASLLGCALVALCLLRRR